MLKNKKILLWFLCPVPLMALTIGQVAPGGFVEQVLGLLRFQDVTLRLAFLGFTLLGVQCGLLGCYVLVRRMALIGDTLAHAVFPGVVLGFCWNMTKNPVALLLGASVAAWAGVTVFEAIKRHTPLKPDAALALVLSGFYGLGAFLLSCLQKHPAGAKAGLDRLLFGQAAALGVQDVALMAIGLVALVLLISLFYKELLVTSFDPAFAQSLALPLDWVNAALITLLAFTVVVALQAVGALLLSALFVLPGATAFLITRSFTKMLGLSVFFALLSGWLGTAASFLAAQMPTGPCVILFLGVFFLLAFMFSPLHGWLPQYYRHRKNRLKAHRENTLKHIYSLLEKRKDHGLLLKSLADHSGLLANALAKPIKTFQKEGLVDILNPEAPLEERFLQLTPAGIQTAQAVIRRHRLWELYLTHSAAMAPDHVHDDAEAIEHVLGDALVAELDRSLNFPSRDPHGQAIPKG